MKPRRTQSIKTIRNWIKDILLAIIIVLLLTSFGVQNLRVLGNSMAPTLLDGHLVIINKAAYIFSEPKKGDIVGFYSENIKQKVVKRIIGMPGDIIDYREHRLYVNQVPFNYTDNEKIRPRGDIKYPYTVPEDSYFVIGDNINSSIDSRYKSIGPIAKDKIIGKIGLRVWPFWKQPLLK